MQPTFWSVPNYFYLAIAVVSIYGCALFLWWWWKVGRATEVYVYVTMLMLGIGLTAGFAARSRWLHSYSGEQSYLGFVTSLRYSIGPGIVFILLCIISFRMTRRVWANSRLQFRV